MFAEYAFFFVQQKDGFSYMSKNSRTLRCGCQTVDKAVLGHKS